MKYPLSLKLVALLFLISSYVNTSYAQLSQVVTQGDIYAPPSPNAAALLRYANVPVDEHTGIASVVLPINQLSGRQLSVPITLSYHGAGIKVQDLASNVGLGFVLNAGGVITRDMRGLPDESQQGYQYNGKKVYSSNADTAYLNASMNGKIDGEPDMFYFNFMGHTGKMVIDTAGNAQYLPDQGIRVIRHPIHNNPDSTNNSWVLKDLNGTTYEFGVDTSSREITIANLAGQPITKAISYISSWYLARITSPDGKETVNFNYTSGPAMNYEQYRYETTYNIHDDVTLKRKSLLGSKVIQTDNLSTKNVQKIDISTIIQVPSPKYLSSIQNDMGSVTLSYIPRQDISGGLALNQINIYNINDAATPLKTYTFNESYFLSANPTNQVSPDFKRLRLDCVTLQGRSSETKQLFVFGYNEQTILPARNSDNFDHWGYYTTLDERAGYPSVHLITDNGNLEESYERRVPDSTKMQACMLTKIRNVNGGYTDFFYQPNYYKYNGAKSFGGGLRIREMIQTDSLGQVTPIVTQYAYSLDDGTSSGMIYNPKPYYIQGITNYQANYVVKPIPSLISDIGTELKNPLDDLGIAVEIGEVIGGSSPVGLAIDVAVIVVIPALADTYDFLFKRTKHTQYDSPPYVISSCPLNNLFDANGASVTYSQVKKINGDGSYLMDYYTGQQDYPDSASAVELNLQTQPVKAIYGNAGSYPPSTSFDFERGLLKVSKAYDNQKNIVSQVTNTYQLSKRVAAVTGQRSSVSGYATLQNNSFQVITYDVGIYKDIAENIQLVKSITQLYDQDHSGRVLTDTINYTWQPVYPTLVHSQTGRRSDGKLLVNYVSYPMEYASGTQFIDDMVRHYMLAVPIENVNTLQSPAGTFITGGSLRRFKPGGAGLLDTVFSVAASNPIPLANFKFSNQVLGTLNGNYNAYGKDKSYIARAFYQVYDSKDNLSQSQNIGEPSSSVIWGYNQDVPVAQISNAMINQVAYTSFETNDQRFWTFAASGRDSSGLAKTGKIRYQLSSGAVNTTNALPAGAYILSLWTQGAKPTISGALADAAMVSGESDKHSWNFYMDRITVAANATITLSGSGFIDELRLYPQGAHISTVALVPQVGVSSVSSPDDKVNTYEYDALQRNATIRDDQYNVLKQYSYSNILPVSCTTVPDIWQGINPVCYSDKTNITPDTNNYKAQAVNSYGNLLCLFSRTASESAYLGQINYTVSFSDQTTYSSYTTITADSLNTVTALELDGKSADAVTGIGIDSVINLTDDYSVGYQNYQNRQRVRDGFIEANTLTGGIGPYIAPTRGSTGCPTLFSNQAQTNFFKNNCTTGEGSEVIYTIPAGTYTAATQFSADSLARIAGQTYANTHGTCSPDTSWVGTSPYCTASTADSGTPSLSAYSIHTSTFSNFAFLIGSISRSSAEAAHDAMVSYTLTFSDGSTALYTTPMYKNQQLILISLPLTGYTVTKVSSVAITGVSYSSLKRLAYSTRARLLNGVADGYSEPNTTGVSDYLAPIEDQGACGTWYYNTQQTGFYRNNCSVGSYGSQVSYTVLAHTDSSMVSQTYADALAHVRGQSYVNTNGSCSTSPPSTSPPTNIITVTFEIGSSSPNITYFALIANNNYIAGPRSVSSQNTQNAVVGSFPGNASSTIVFPVTSGYMPVSATLTGSWGTVHGVISGSTITFSGADLTIGQSVYLQIN